MTIQEAIKMFRAGIETAECEQKKELYTWAITALEKQIPVKPIENGYHHMEDGYFHLEKACPNCGTDIQIVRLLPHYCPNCGQALTEEKRGEQYGNQQ